MISSQQGFLDRRLGCESAVLCLWQATPTTVAQVASRSSTRMKLEHTRKSSFHPFDDMYVGSVALLGQTLRERNENQNRVENRSELVASNYHLGYSEFKQDRDLDK